MRLIFEWDKNKARTNLGKHKVSFEEAKTLFSDPLMVSYPDEHHSDIEERFVSIGLSDHDRVLLLIHSEKREAEDTVVIRIISCRKATPLERRIYEEGNE